MKPPAARDEKTHQEWCRCKKRHGTMPAWDKEAGWTAERCTRCGRMVTINGRKREERKD